MDHSVTPVTIRLYDSDMRLESSKENEEIPILDLSNLSTICMECMRKVARIGNLYGQATRLSDNEFGLVLDNLVEIGRELTDCIFESKEQTVLDRIVKSFPGENILLKVYDNNLWIPWELLYFDKKEVRIENFLGFNRNIYRTPIHKGRKPEISDLPDIGFLSHRGVPCAIEEFDLMEKHRGKIGKREWNNFLSKASMLNWLSPFHILHFAGLIAPIQYINQSFILVDIDFWISPNHFSEIEYFEFTAAPLVILNLRDNYARDPRHIVQYVQLLLKRGASGVIASELPTSPKVSEAFTEYFYYYLLANDSNIGQALLDTKIQFFDERNNPFAMFYAPYFSFEESKVTHTNIERSPCTTCHESPEKTQFIQDKRSQDSQTGREKVARRDEKNDNKGLSWATLINPPPGFSGFSVGFVVR